MRRTSRRPWTRPLQAERHRQTHVLAAAGNGGSVITAAGTAHNVVGLVYISGFAPDEGENLTDLQSKFPGDPKKVAEVVMTAVRACAAQAA